MGFYRGPNMVTDGLVLSLDAGNTKSYTSGSTTWLDKSGYGNNGTLVNGTGFSSLNGGSIVFDGVNDYSICNSPTFNPTGNSDFSVSCWVMLNSLPLANPRVISQGVDANNYYNLGTYGGNSPGTYDAFWFEVRKGGLYYGGFLQTGANKYVANVYYNLVGIFNNSTNTPIFYVNTVIRTGSGVGSSAPSSYGPIIIGSNTTSPTSTLPGNISNIQIYNRTLSSQEVLQNYNATKSRYGL